MTRDQVSYSAVLGIKKELRCSSYVAQQVKDPPWVAPVVWVRSIAQELPYAAPSDIRKERRKERGKERTDF